MPWPLALPAVIDLYHTTNPLGQQGQLIVNVPPEGIPVRILFVAEKLHPNQVVNLYASDKRVLSKFFLPHINTSESLQASALRILSISIQ